MCWAEPNAAGSSTNKPRGCFVQGKRLVLGLHVPAVPGKLSAVITYLLFSDISRQGELVGLRGLEEAGGGTSDSQNQGVHS